MKTSLFLGIAAVAALVGFGAGCAPRPTPVPKQPATTAPSEPSATAPTPKQPASVTAQDLESLKQDVQSLRIDDVSALKQ